MIYTNVVAVVLLGVAFTNGQEPFPGFNQMMSGINTMTSNLRLMGNNLARQGREFGQRMSYEGRQLASRMSAQGERIRESARRRTEWIKSFGPGESQVNTTFGGTAYIYNSPDGSFSSVIFSSTRPNRNGYVFYSGPDGVWERTY